MNIPPAAGLTIVPLPNGKFAIVLVEIAGRRSARAIAKALTDVPPPPADGEAP